MKNGLYIFHAKTLFLMLTKPPVTEHFLHEPTHNNIQNIFLFFVGQQLLLKRTAKQSLKSFKTDEQSWLNTKLLNTNWSSNGEHTNHTKPTSSMQTNDIRFKKQASNESTTNRINTDQVYSAGQSFALRIT